MPPKDEVNYLATWATLNRYVQGLDEQTLQALLKKEQKGEARTQFLIRIYGRYNKLRTIRERKEILSK